MMNHVTPQVTHHGAPCRLRLCATASSTCLTLLSVSSENKRDKRTIEQVMADTKARKKLKTTEPSPGLSTNPQESHDPGSDTQDHPS